MLIRRYVLPAVVIALGACAPRLIPGTDIPKTKDTEAIVALVDKYRQALEKKDIDGLMSLVSESYRDTSGTATPDDDLDYVRLREILPGRLVKLEDVRVDIEIRRIDVTGDTAEAIFRFDTHFKMPAFKSQTQSESDLSRMLLAKVGGVWKIVSGL
jgi:hypothetical protein